MGHGGVAAVVEALPSADVELMKKVRQGVEQLSSQVERKSPC